MAAWVKSNALTILGMLLTAGAMWGLTQGRMSTLETKVQDLQQQLRLHADDHERHMDRRFMDRVIQQMDRIERNVDELSKR